MRRSRGRVAMSLVPALLAATATLTAASAPAAPVGWGAGHRLGLDHPRRCASRARARHLHHRPRRCRRNVTHPRPSANAPALPGSTAAPGARAPAPTPGSGPAAAGTPASPQAPPSAGGGESTLPPPPPSLPHVQVTAVEYSFTLSRTTVPAGKVVFEFVNNGQDEHNMNALPGEGPPAGSFPNTPSKGVSDMQMELRRGTYTLFCSLPEHEQKGMKATLVVQ